MQGLREVTATGASDYNISLHAESTTAQLKEVLNRSELILVTLRGNQPSGPSNDAKSPEPCVRVRHSEISELLACLERNVTEIAKLVGA